MARVARVVSSTNIYHVVLRTINQQQLFEDDEDFGKFLFILGDVQKNLQFKLYSYCLMGNHVHLLIENTACPLGTIFQSIGSRFGIWYNTKYQRFGHVFQDRYRSRPVETNEDFFNVLRYIHDNPVKANMCKYAVEYRWSSAGCYLGKKDLLIDKKRVEEIAGSKNKLQVILKEDLPFFDTIDYEYVRSSMSDKKAKELIYKIAGTKTPSEFLSLPRCTRNDYVIKLCDNGLMYTQISRLCGVSRTTIYRLRNNET